MAGTHPAQHGDLALAAHVRPRRSWPYGPVNDGTYGPLRVTAECLNWQVSGYG
jgi:hypothetical protein